MERIGRGERRRERQRRCCSGVVAQDPRCVGASDVTKQHGLGGARERFETIRKREGDGTLVEMEPCSPSYRRQPEASVTD